MANESPSLRAIIQSIVSSSSVTHATLYDYCSKLGLNVSFEPVGTSKTQRLREVVANTPDETLPIVGNNLLAQDLVGGEQKFMLQDLLWEPQGEISKRCRREIAEILEIEDLYRDGKAFFDLLRELFVTYQSSDVFSNWAGVDLDKVERHVYRNPGDWTVEYFWGVLGVFDISSRRFSKFLEGLSHGDIQNCVERQKTFVDKVNSRLKVAGFELREAGSAGGYPDFKVVTLSDRATGRPKNLIFASSEKPDIRFRDAVNNDIEIVTNADKVLIYDRPINHNGLTWRELQDWFRDAYGLESDEKAKNGLYNRLRKSLPKNSPPQLKFFDSYFQTFKKQIPALPALLPEVWLHWDARTVKERGTNALLRSRMDFLLLLPSDVRVVIEIDGQHHYAIGDLACPRKYSDMVHADRLLKLDGYHVFRFGGYELTGDSASELTEAFWGRLFQRFGIAV